MKTWNQLVFILYGIVSRVHSLNSLCKCLLFLEGKLSYLGIKSLPATSTLYVCLVSLLQSGQFSKEECDLEKIQLILFSLTKGGVLEKKGKSPLKREIKAIFIES